MPQGTAARSEDRASHVRKHFRSLIHAYTDFIAAAHTSLAEVADLDNPVSLSDLVQEIKADPACKALALTTNNQATRLVNNVIHKLSPCPQPPPLPARANNNSPYLQALTRNAILPVTTLPRLRPGNATTPAPAAETVSPELQNKMRKSINGIFGFERNRFVRIRTEGREPFSKPADLRFALQQGGLPTPVAIAKTSDPRLVYALAPESGAKVMQQAFERTKQIAAHEGRDIPKLRFELLESVGDTLNSADETKIALHALEEEIGRLEHDECRWRPRFFYAKAMPAEHTILLLNLRSLDPSSTQTALQPPPVPPVTPSRLKRRHDDAPTGESPEHARPRVTANANGHNTQQPRVTQNIDSNGLPDEVMPDTGNTNSNAPNTGVIPTPGQQ